MKVVGRDGAAVLVDLQRSEKGVALGCVVADGQCSPALPLEKFLEAGLWDEPVDDADAVLAVARDAQPSTGVRL